MSEPRTAWAVGFDVGTGGVEAGIRSVDGHEAAASIDISDETQWHGQPAFAVAPLPQRLHSAVEQLQSAGWSFQGAEQPAVSFSVRQHDMCLVDRDGRLLLDGHALGWRCNAAEAEVEELRDLGAEQTVGRIEARFILPKLRWLLKTEPALRSHIHRVMTTGDYAAWKLTGVLGLSTSDALSNGLLNQQTRELAVDVLEQAGFDANWFPPVIHSGTVVGTVAADVDADPAWTPLRETLAGWSVVAGLGDNHATGVGCGLHDERTIVISAGNSGTINRLCRADATLKGQAACFEFYDRRLLLMMLADCAVWYDRFRRQYAPNIDHGELNRLAEEAIRSDTDSASIVCIEQRREGARWVEIYPSGFDGRPLGVQVASTQFSIAAELLLRVRSMLEEVENAQVPVDRFVLTGGLSQSPFFQHVFVAGLPLLVPDAQVGVSARSGPLAYQTAAYGALINALLPTHYGGNLDQAVSQLCPTRDCAKPDTTVRGRLEALLKPLLTE